MIDGIANSIVNNLADRLGEVVEVLSPVVESANTVARTLVQETTSVGFAYVVVGCGCIVTALLAICSLIVLLRFIGKNSEDIRIVTTTMLIIFACVMFIIGIITMLANIQSWIAPTKGIIRELIQVF